MREVLPEGWITTYLKQVVIPRKGKKPNNTIDNAKDGYVPYILIAEMEGNPIRKYTNDHNVPIANEKDVLIVWDGSIGKTATGLNGAIGSTITALTPVVIKPKFLEGFLKLSKTQIEQTSRGTGLQHINPNVLWKLIFPLPPLNEQKRIIAKLDRIIPRIEAVRERLEKVPAIIKRFRQAVLSDAVTGKLTEKWRENDESPWEKTTLGCLSEYVTSGSRGWAKYYSDSGAIFIRAQNIKTDELLLNDVAYVTLPEKVEGKRTKINKGDILVTITGANVTKTAFVRSEIPEAYVNQHIALIRLENFKFADYLHLWLISPNAGRLQLENSAYGAGKPGLNLNNIKEVSVELPPLEEQQEIVRQVDRLFALADKIESHYNKAKIKVEKLTQSVLAKAFRGELVPQDPEDESAEKLLEGIREEKAKMEGELKAARKITRHGGKIMGKYLIKNNLISIIKNKKNGITPENLFKESRYSIDEIGDFYLELKSISKEIEETRVKNDIDKWPKKESILLKFGG